MVPVGAQVCIPAIGRLVVFRNVPVTTATDCSRLPTSSHLVNLVTHHNIIITRWHRTLNVSLIFLYSLDILFIVNVFVQIVVAKPKNPKIYVKYFNKYWLWEKTYCVRFFYQSQKSLHQPDLVHLDQTQQHLRHHSIWDKGLPLQRL